MSLRCNTHRADRRMTTTLTDNQILRWASNLLAREVQDELYGSVTFTMQKGKVISSRVERTEKPSLDGSES